MHNLIPEYILDQFQTAKTRGNFGAAALFMDISGFTAITENLMTYGRDGAEVISDVLEFVFDEPISAVYQNNGFVASFLGDAFTALFPVKTEESKQQTIVAALETAKKIREALKRNFRSKFGEFQFDVKIGLAFGDVEWTIFGDQNAHTYCFSGIAITNCARCENLASNGEIWCDNDFLKNAGNLISTDRSYEIYSRISQIKKMPISHGISLQLIKEYPPELMIAFAGKSEVSFTNPELRDVSTVYLALEETYLLNNFMLLVFEQTKIWGGSHPHLYYGDKGWNLVIFFGAPIAHGSHPDRALHFLLNLKEQLPKDFKLKGGITSGKLYAGFNGAGLRREFTCLGSKVNLACRYMAFADWNEFLCDQTTAKEQQFSFEFRGNLSFKGNLNYISTYRLLKGVDQKKNDFNYAFIGREEELTEITELVKPIFRGKFAGIIYIDGSAGVGKTRLLNEFRNRLSETLVKRTTTPNRYSARPKLILNSEDDQFFWLHFPCEEILRRSFYPVLYFLKNYFNISDNHNINQNQENFRSKFNQLFDTLPRGELKEILHNRKGFLLNQLITSSNEHHKLFSGRDFYDNFIYTVKALIRALSLSMPVIINLEDAQWIDTETDRFINALTSGTENMPLAILASCRYTEDGSKVRLSAKNAQKNRIKLKPFTLRDSFCFTEKILHKEISTSRKSAISGKIQNIPQATFEKIWDISEGNPFLIEQLATYLSENSFLNNDLSLKIQQLELPATINAVTTARIDKLSPLLKETVKAAAVMGREFDTRVLAGLIDWDLQQILPEGSRELIWQPVNENRYAFSHALLRDCAYQMQLSRQLKELHIKTADQLLNLHKSNPVDFYGEIAYHYESGDSIAQAVKFYEQAGDLCSSAYKNNEALAHYNKILDFLAVWREVKIDSWEIGQNQSTNPLLTELKQSLEIYLRNLLKKTKILHHNGRWQETEPLCKEIIALATRINHLSYAARGHKYLGRYYHTAANDNLAMKHYKKAKRLYMLAKDIDGLISVLTYLGDCCEKRNEIKKASQFYRFQLKLAEQHQHKKGLADAYWKIGNINLYHHRYKTALNYYQKKLTLSEELDDKQGISIALNNISIIYVWQNEPEKAIPIYERQLKIVKEIGSLSSISRAFSGYAQFSFTLNDKKTANEYLDKALIIDRELNIHSSLMITTMIKAKFLTDQGKHQEAFVLAEEALHHARVAASPEHIQNSTNLLKIINFNLLKNRAAKIEYLKNLTLELDKEPVSEQKISDFMQILEMSVEIKYRCKTALKQFKELLGNSKIRTTQRQILLEQVKKIINKGDKDELH